MAGLSAAALLITFSASGPYTADSRVFHTFEEVATLSVSSSQIRPR
jgi:hypothetical protein